MVKMVGLLVSHVFKVGVLNNGEKHSISSLPEFSDDISSSFKPHGKPCGSNTATFCIIHKENLIMYIPIYTACTIVI